MLKVAKFKDRYDFSERTLQYKRDLLFNDMITSSFDSEGKQKNPLSEVFTNDHPFLHFDLIDFDNDIFTYRISYKNCDIKDSILISTFVFDCFVFSVGVEKVVGYFKRHLYKGLRGLLFNKTHQDTEEEIHALKIISDGQIEWAAFGNLIHLLTKNFVELGLFKVLVKEDDEFYSVMICPGSEKIKIKQLLIQYEKAALFSDYAFISDQFDDYQAGQSLKDMLTMDLCRTFYHEIKAS